MGKLILLPVPATSRPDAADARQAVSARYLRASPAPAAKPGPTSASRLTVPLFAVTLFLSSALMFLVEPMLAKSLLPLLGGTPAVWNTCMVFFQACLLGGYALAHGATRLLGPRRQALVHLGLVALAALALPVRIDPSWTPPSGDGAVLWLLRVLAVSVGLPFLVLSMTGPVLQRWYAATGHRSAVDPYFLYAASNLGSMLALLLYPAAVEPLLRLAAQSRLWTDGYALLAMLTLLCAAQAWPFEFAGSEMSRAKISAPGMRAPVTERDAPIAWRRRFKWIGLSFVPSSLLLGVTTFITTDIAAVPLLWVAPLALYLLSFILVFLRRPLIPPAVFRRMLPIAVLSVTLLLLGRIVQPLWVVLAIHLTAFFIACMVCHERLAVDRPPATRLTDFYLMLSIGGVLGGLFNALAAPRIFSIPLEYPIGLALACGAGQGAPAAGPKGRSFVRRAALEIALPAIIGLLAWKLPRMSWVTGAASTGTLRTAVVGIPVLLAVSTIRRPWRLALSVAAMLAAFSFAGSYHGELLAVRRSFFGVHRIVKTPEGFNDLYHGSTIHGRQNLSAAGEPICADEPLTYYTRTGPIGQVFSSLAPSAGRLGRTVRVVGLGVGSLAAYARRGDEMTFYEIDPMVLWAARDSGRFTFLNHAQRSGAMVDVVMGDARLTLAGAPAGGADLLVLDAFSGDAVPAHLLTREAMRIYRRTLAPGGVLAIHISNVYLDLRPVVAALASDAGCICYIRNDIDVSPDQVEHGKMPSQWVVIAAGRADIEALTRNPQWSALAKPPNFSVWRDDFSNVLGILRWRR